MVDRGVIAASSLKKEPEAGASQLLIPLTELGAKQILLVECDKHRVDYEEIYEFGRGTIRSLSRRRLDPRSIAMILHGPGYGLDTDLCFERLIDGVCKGLTEHSAGVPSLAEICIVEQQANRRDRMASRATQLWPFASKHEQTPVQKLVPVSDHNLRRIFVAMPFGTEFSDVWEYGFYNPAKDANCICERSDRAVFDGDIMEWIMERIRQADLVIAEVSTAKANVYLEIGYAWGLGKKTLLVSRQADSLEFDVRNHRCIIYKTIKELESAIRVELPMHIHSTS